MVVGPNPVAVTETSDFVPALSKEFLDMLIVLFSTLSVIRYLVYDIK